MANTVRTESQLFSLFPDNIVGAITAQDGRDLIASTFGFAGSAAPSVTNDSVDTAGVGAFFDTGSVWVDTTHGEWYFCVSGAPGAAVWLPRCCTTPTGPFVTSSGDPGVTPLTVEGVAGQTAPLQRWQVPAGTTLAEVLATGQFETFLDNLTAWIINQGSVSQTVPFLEILNFLGSVLWEISQFGESLSVGVGVALASLAVNHTFTRDDSILLVDATGANRTVTLPLASSFPPGRPIAVKKIDASVHTVAITPNVADLLEGDGSLILAKQFDWAVLIPDGVSAWYIFAANVDTAVQNAGTVTSVDMSIPGLLFNLAGNPITTAGTLALTLKNQNANSFLAGPSSGAAAAPTFRGLASADIPTGVPQILKFTVGFAQLAAAGAVTTTTITLQAPMPAYSILFDGWAQVLAAESFQGGAIMGVVLQLNSSAAGSFGNQAQVKVAVDTYFPMPQASRTTFNFFGTTSTALRLVATSSGANLNALTQGKITIWVLLWIGQPP